MKILTAEAKEIRGYIAVCVKDQIVAEEIEEVKDQKVRTAFFRIGDTKLELLESTAPDGPVGKFIGKRGPGIHHIAFAFLDADAALKDAREKGVKLIDESSRKGAEGLDIGFLHPGSTFGMLTEFCSVGE